MGDSGQGPVPGGSCPAESRPPELSYWPDGFLSVGAPGATGAPVP